jgi:hypothetical protein
MTHFKHILTLLMLLSSCVGQERGGTDPRGVLPILSEILGKAGVSGSLEYWGGCRLPVSPDVPPVIYPSNHSGSAVDVLGRFFSSDPLMQVTQEPNGLIRMAETDVPTDLLDVKISHVSFDRGHQQPYRFGGPNNAMSLVLSAPEVKAYRKAHNIGPFSDLWVGPGDSASKQRVSGDLYNVTVRQALDYILQFYPGFWLYENCLSSVSKSGRNVVLSFFIADLPHANSDGRASVEKH